MNGSNKRKLILILIIIASLVLGGILIKQLSSLFSSNDYINESTNEINETLEETQNDSEINESNTETLAEEEVEDRVETLKVKAFGDLLYHNPLIWHGENMAGGNGYDFTDQFEKIADFIGDADITLGNFEGSHNPNYPYAGYPQFNIPAELFTTMKEIGVDYLATANNHSLDTNIEGLEYTIDAIEAAGLDNFGTQKSPEDKYIIVEKNGIKVGLMAYAEMLNGFEVYLDTPEKQAKINMLNPEMIKTDIEYLRANGADVVILYPHWGIEYVEKNSPEFVELARNMIEWGADAVLGNHPHVVLPSEEYTASDGRRGFIIHSMGNFISNQTLETLSNIRTEHSAVVELDFEKNFSTGETKLTDVNLHPTWLKRTYDDFGGYLHQTVLAEEHMENGPKANELSPEQVQRATTAYNMTMEKLNESVE